MGATGNVGRELVAILAERGHGVRAMAHHAPPAADLPAGVRGFAVDLTDGPSLREALDGAAGAFMLSGYDDAGIAAALEDARVGSVVLLSSGAVATASPDNAVAGYHRASEQALGVSSLAWTFLRPNTFMTNALRWADAIRAGEPVVAPFAEVAIATVDPRDVAAAAAIALTSGAHAGRAHRITGPEALLPAEQVAILGEVLGREIAFRAQPDDEARAQMEAAMPSAYVDAFFEFFTEGGADETTVLFTVADVTGAPPRTFRDWVTAHAAAFG